MAIAGPRNWDGAALLRAVHTVRQGGSPYADGIAEQIRYENLPAHAKVDHERPHSFIYSPLALFILRQIAWWPIGLMVFAYWSAVAGGFLLQLWAAFQMAEAHERRWLAWILPFAAFFPGMVASNDLMSGNIAYILYGFALAAAVAGWKRNQWFWFYVAVLVASICKAPMLSLLAFPILTGRGQWVRAAGTGAIGCLLFAGQPLLWPQEFREFMDTVRIAFEGNHDFGASPSGLLGRTLWQMHQAYSPATTFFYLGWAVVLGTLLVMMSRRAQRHGLTQEWWIPIAFLGTILLNPRIKDYDVAPLTIPMLLIAIRLLVLMLHKSKWWRARRTEGRPDLVVILAGLSAFAVCNIVDALWGEWVPTTLTVLLSALAMGFSSLRSTARRQPQPVLEEGLQAIPLALPDSVLP